MHAVNTGGWVKNDDLHEEVSLCKRWLVSLLKISYSNEILVVSLYELLMPEVDVGEKWVPDEYEYRSGRNCRTIERIS